MPKRTIRGVAAPNAQPVEYPASEVKNAWHEVLDRVSQAREEIVITRYGRPIARLAPVEAGAVGPGIFGCLAGSVRVQGDLIAPIGEPWGADG